MSRRGPLGDLPALSPSARRALVVCGLLSVLNAVAIVAQAWALSSVLASVVTGHGDRPFALLAGAVVARSALVWALDTMSARAAAGAKEELRARALDRAMAHGPEWIAARGPAELTVLATKGLDALDAYFTRYLPALVTAAVVPLLVGVAILVEDVPSAVLIAITVPLIPLFAILIGKYTEQRTAKSADATARLSGHLLELVRALPVLTAFGRAQAQAEAVRRVGEQHRKATGSTLRVAFLSAFALETIATLSVALVAVDIGLRLVGGTLGLATGLLVLVLTPECYLPLRAAGAAFHASEDGLEAVRRVAEIGPVAPTAGAIADGEIKVDRLSVERRGTLAPDGASFTVRSGHITRLDSPSGAGKSTTLAVLLGFVRPTRGLVTVGGVDLSTVDLSTWRRQVAWVPQRPAFSAEIVADELALVGGDLVGVAARVGAAHLLERPIVELSTGERQRVAIARALLRVEQGARWLLLDEPTAHLDAATAGLVMAAVEDAAASGVGVLLATHRVAAAEDAATVAGVASQAVKADLVAPKARITALLNRRSVAGVLLGVLAVGSGIALTATAAWLIARASQQPPEAALAVAVVAVRAFGLGKGALRYVERLVTHDAAFRLGGRLRGQLWDALVRLGPARTTTLRRTDGVQRLVDDTDAVRDLVPRVLVPPLVGLLVAIGAVMLEAAVMPTAGAVLAVALLVAGIGGTAVAMLVERRATAALAAGRRDVAAKVLTLFDAAPDLIAFGAVRRRRSELAAADAELAATARRQALGAGAANAAVTASIGVATLICAWLAATAAGLDSVLVPLLALVPLATTEAVAAIPPAAQQWGALRSAYQRVTELTGACGEEGSTRRESPSPRDTIALADMVEARQEARLAGAEGQTELEVAGQAQRERGVRLAGVEDRVGVEPDVGLTGVVGRLARERGVRRTDVDDRAGVEAAVGLAGVAGRAEGERGVRFSGVEDRAAVEKGVGLTGVGGQMGAEQGARAGVQGRAGVEQGVRLSGVDVRWPGAERPTLTGVDLCVPAGSWVAVVGPSGAGKSTLMALLLGFLGPDRGEAEVPGVVSWCPQEPQLVSTTVRENLRLGDPEASDERLREALRDAQLESWTDRLDVVVGTGGAAVSGGEGQRLAMARALLRADHAGLVLLDEPTAHLDEPTAHALLARLRSRLAGRTVVHITHRLDEAAEADLLIEVSDGTIRLRQREAV